MIYIREKKYGYLEEANEGILKNVPANIALERRTVLDVGCGCAALAEAIQKKGYIVWGIEAEKEAASMAGKRIDKVINADLTDLSRIKNEIGNKTFDCLVFSDVLEHVYDPFSILREYLQFLKRSGLLLISVPNVAVWLMRFKLLFGRFQYADTGVLDRTHIRFFTFLSAKALIKTTGCSIIKVDYTPFIVRAALPLVKKILSRNIDSSELDRSLLKESSAYKIYMKCIYPIEYWLAYLFKPFFAFRIIVVARKP